MQMGGSAQRLARDRSMAQLWAALFTTPIWLVALMLTLPGLWLAWEQLHSSDSLQTRLPSERGLVTADLIAVSLLVAGGFLFIAAGWSFVALRAALTPQRITIMWLRRFQAETGERFRVSRVVDRLGRQGISAITLQDRDVRLSFEQRRARMAPRLWIVTILILAGPTSFFVSLVQSNVHSSEQEWGVLGLILAILLYGLVALALFVVLAPVILALASAIGPLGAALSSQRDDFRRLPKLLHRVSRGKQRGATIVRVADSNWREAVVAALKVVDAVIVDVTDLTEHIVWEIKEAVAARGSDRLIFVCAGPENAHALDAAQRERLADALGHEPGDIISYPTTRAREARHSKRIRRTLSEAIYRAAWRQYPTPD